MKPASSLLAACLALLLGGVGSTARAQFTVATTAAYTEGDFGEAKLTEVFTVTPAVEYLHDRWSVRLTTPQYHVRGPENVIAGVGRVENGRHGFGAQSGAGDPVLSIACTLTPMDDRRASHELGLEFKPGLIDAGQLGSGRTDYAVRWGAYRSWGDMSLFLHFGLRFVGNPDGWDLRNHVYTTLGWKRQVTSDTALGFVYTGTSKTSRTTASQGQIMAFLSRRIGAYDCQAALLGGASRSSASLGMMLSVSLGL